MSRVFVLDKNKQPLDPCHSARARELLTKKQAAVFRRYPFTIILKERTLEQSEVHEHRLKIDPGSKITGIAIVQKETNRVVFAAELEHRGNQIKSALISRRLSRRNRRNRKTRYRQARFINRATFRGSLTPSLRSRVYNIQTWARRLISFCPVNSISQELVKFDTQKLQNPEIEGVEYQRGKLFGFEVWEYLLQKFHHKCVYCGIENIPLEKEHIIPVSRGGSNRVSNLTVACRPCNLKKGNKTAEEFGFFDVQRLTKKPLKDAGIITTIRWRLLETLKDFGLPVECGSGGRTKYNRTRLGLEKTHWTDAACVGESTPDILKLYGVRKLLIRACGHGRRQQCRTDKYGFPNRHKPRSKKFLGWQTGDIAIANILSGKYKGIYIGRVIIRFSGKFSIGPSAFNYKYMKKLHRADGYSYAR